MTDLIRIGAAFALIVALLRFRWNIGIVMLAGALFLGALYRIGPSAQARVLFLATIDPASLSYESSVSPSNQPADRQGEATSTQ